GGGHARQSAAKQQEVNEGRVCRHLDQSTSLLVLPPLSTTEPAPRLRAGACRPALPAGGRALARHCLATRGETPHPSPKGWAPHLLRPRRIGIARPSGLVVIGT